MSAPSRSSLARERFVRLANVATMSTALVWASYARAEPVRPHAPSTYVLDYRVSGPRCPDGDELKSLVAARVGRDPFVPASTEAAHVVHVTSASKGDGTLEITVATEGEPGQPPLGKTFRGAARECTELVQRAALTVALLVDEEPEKPASEAPEAATPTVTPPPGRAPEPVPLARPVAPPSPPPSEQTPARTGLGFAIAGHAGGAALHPSALVEVIAMRRFAAWSFGVVGRVGLPTSGAFPEGRVSTTTLGAGPLVCVGVRRADVCIPVTVGALLGSGGDTAEARTDASPFVTFGLRPEVHLVPFGAFEVTAFAEGYAAPARTSFTFRAGTAWSSAPVGAMVGISGKLGLF